MSSPRVKSQHASAGEYPPQINNLMTVCDCLSVLVIAPPGIGPNTRGKIGRVRYSLIMAGIANARCRYRLSPNYDQ